MKKSENTWSFFQNVLPLHSKANKTKVFKRKNLQNDKNDTFHKDAGCRQRLYIR